MRELLPVIEAWRADGLEIARAVVIRTYGSAPRREGASLLLAGDGRLEGSVSGGCVEGSTAEHLAVARESGEQRVVRFGISDEEAWDVGLACGGVVDVLVQPAIPAAVLAAAQATQTDRKAARVVISPLPPGSPEPVAGASALGPAAMPGRPLIVHHDGHLEGSLGGEADDAALVEAATAHLSRGTCGTMELGGRQLFLEAFPPRARLVIVGAVPVAAFLVRQARELGYETVVVDARPAFATRERMPDVDELLRGWLDEVADELGLGPSDAVAVLSHDPKLDDPAIVEALRRGCCFVGAIGSRRGQAARRARLLDQGVTAEQLDRLHGPIGLDLGGREPAETALAIMAEIVAARHGASARPMVELAGERGPRGREELASAP